MSDENDKTRTHIVLTKGTMVSHYRIVEKIGAGGMGEVYLAEDTKLKRNVALKFLPPHLCQSEDCRARFKREAQATAKLDHPNIIHVYEVSEYQDRPYFAMQHVEGQSLKDIIAGNDLSLDRIVELALQICEGLSKAHQSEIVHRDIKPSNIVIDSDGHPKLLDFGLAAIKDTDQLTKTGSTLGTIGYMSPEQIEGKDADYRSDLFSLGVVIYEMITGRLPFKGDTKTATMNAVLNNTPEPLSRFKSGISGEMQKIISKLLEKDPQLRYQTAMGVVADLKKLAGEDKSGRVKPQRDWWNRYVVPSAIVILSVVIGYLYFSGRDSATSSTGDRIMLAVLPFENLGVSEDEYFADGMTEEITARLASVKELGVIARTSIKQYKNTEKSIEQIGKELGIDYILEGTVRWQKSTTEPDRVRVTPQLIRVSDATHLWANIYDEEVSEIFQLQSNIAEQVVDALNITLVESEKEALATKPTANLEAYDYYLRGKEYYDRYKSMEDLGVAVGMFEKAIEIDSTFASAHAWLTQLYLIVPAFIDPIIIDSLKQLSYQHAVKAQQYSNNGIEGHLAMGYYFYGNQEFDNALDAFNEVLKKQPNNIKATDATAGVLQSQGHWEESLARYKKSYQLDPRSVGASWGLALTYYYMRRFEEGNEITERGLSLSPDWWPFKTLRAWAAAAEYQSPDSALTMIENSSTIVDEQFIESFKVEHLFLKRDFAQCVAISTTADNMWHGDSARYYLLRGHAYDKLGQKESAYSYYDSAQTTLKMRIERGSESAFDFISLGRVYAHLGDTVLALDLGRQGYNMLPISKNAPEGAYALEGLARIYSLTGQSEDAIDILDTLLSVPSHFNLVDAKMAAYWDPLRNHPRFKALMEKYDEN